MPVVISEPAASETPTAPLELEEARFAALQSQLPHMWRTVMNDPQADQTVIVVPSMSLDAQEMRKLKGVVHYEERMLFLLILLAHPKTRLIFVTSMPVHPSIIDYYLQLLPGIPSSHARQRLHLFSAYDNSVASLAKKIVDRPTLVERIRRCINRCTYAAGTGIASSAHLTCFNVTQWERQLSVALRVPLYGANPRHAYFGHKSGARKLFGEVGLNVAPGFEDLRDEHDIAESIVELHERHRDLRRVVVKLNDGFSGEGNAVYSLQHLQKKANGTRLSAREARAFVLHSLPRQIRFQAPDAHWDEYIDKFRQMRGIVENFIEGKRKRSPSVQLRVNPLREVELISTHDQILGGPDGQTFIGCRFPAQAAYCQPMHEAAVEVGKKLAEAGVLGRLSIDFLAVPTAPRCFDMFAVEINLRKGGTTHPFRTLQFLTGGSYNPERSRFETPSGEAKYYVASDNLESELYRGLLPIDLIDITTYSGLHYSSAHNTGAVFHMIGALSEFGKVGVTCIGNTPTDAQQLYDRTVRMLDEQSQHTQWMV